LACWAIDAAAERDAPLTAPLHIYLPSLLFTLAVELPLLVLLLRGRCDWHKAVLAGVVGTGVMHPTLWYLWPHLFETWLPYIVTGELLVLAVEAVVIHVVARPGSFYAALAASGLVNAASYLGGVGLRALGWWPGS
jgi:hypothetical protein